MANLTELNQQQYEAVTQFNGPMMILAGAGTGKTRVITFRIAHMLRQGVNPEAIVALSFTNKAAREMSERVKHIAGSAARKVWLGTFHSFCLGILRAYPEEAGLARRFGLAGTSDQIDLVRRALDEKKWGGIYHAEEIHSRIGRAKNHLLSPEDLRQGIGANIIKGDMPIVAEVFELYERQLKLNRVIDFDDCIYKTVRLLRQAPAVRAKLQAQYRYLLVDEYQDTNEAQLTVLELLANSSRNVCVVGDDDQSIYSWRGAMYETLERFEELFPGTRIVKLEQNYRCSNVILDAANQVIRNNTRRKDKTLWSASDETAPILLTSRENEIEEAQFVTEKCIGLLGSGLQPKDIGILYRANAQARPLELALREAHIHYKTYGGQSFFERKEVKDFLCYLRLVINPNDRLALWRIINTPNRGIGLKTLEKIETLSSAARKSPYEVMRSQPDDLDTRTAAAVGKFVEIIQELAGMPLTQARDFEALGQAIVKNTGLENDIKVKTENAASRDRKLESLRSLPQWLSTVAQDLIDEHGFLDMETFLDTITLDGDKREAKEKDKNHVSLMTIHAAKGLEFPAVFLIGVEEEQLPHKNSILDPEALCEERRLFYVALTRAKKKLFISYTHERSSSYQKQNRQPSRFLRELPESTYVRDQESQAFQTAEARTESRKANTITKLSKLRANLASGKWS